MASNKQSYLASLADGPATFAVVSIDGYYRDEYGELEENTDVDGYFDGYTVEDVYCVQEYGIPCCSVVTGTAGTLVVQTVDGLGGPEIVTLPEVSNGYKWDIQCIAVYPSLGTARNVVCLFNRKIKP